ncbi:MAG: glycoside hydrolase family 3 C-terminal domain-containing protein [Oscillospiraceae bacterium]|nr:glycoside hydrolase family 3 C-terminal domain-containing protein [Oscillospiraceae bacterium]
MEKYLDRVLSFEERAVDLVSRMTLAEKASQTSYDAPAIRRLGIPSYNWWNEALHGVARAGTATVFPQAIAMAAAFDDELVGQVADVISTEGRAKFNAASAKDDRDIYKGLSFWSPNINIFRDPRWGRGHETYGEDPYLTAELGKAFVRGLQGDGEYLKAAACAKHFAVHSGPENLRHEFDAIADAHDLWETYLPAFEALVTEAKVEAVMGAYNRTNGEPCCGSKTLLVDILRGKWEFEGHVVSDCWALTDFHEHHKITNSAEESVALALKNGCDLNCGKTYLSMVSSLKAGLITEEDIDKAVVHLMTTRLKLGLFDGTEYDDVPFSAIASREHTELALETARRSLVLLKNDGLLPLDRAVVKTIAVVGPNADSRRVLLGNYNGTPPRHVTVLEGIQDLAGDDVRVYYAEGSHLYREKSDFLSRPNNRLSEAVSACDDADVVVLVVGLDDSIEGEEGHPSNPFDGGDKPNLEFPDAQLRLIEAVAATGKPTVLVNMTGSAMNLTFASERFSAILQGWYPGGEGGRAIAEAIFGVFSPSGRLPVTFYRSSEELPDFLDYSMQNRTYRYMKNEAMYPFGYGLSYTSFGYAAASPVSVKLADAAEVSVTVTNTGAVAAREIVECYVQCAERFAYSPVWQLKGFKSVYLQAGESAEVSFTLDKKAFSLVDENGDSVLMRGANRVFVGGGQPDARTLALTGTLPAQFTVDV